MSFVLQAKEGGDISATGGRNNQSVINEYY